MRGVSTAHVGLPSQVKILEYTVHLNGTRKISRFHLFHKMLVIREERREG